TVETWQAMDDAQGIVTGLDAREGITEQDAGIIGLAVQRGRAMVVAINKWDGLSAEQRDRVRALLELKLPFLTFVRTHFISALHGSGVGDLMASVNEAHAAASRDLETPELTRILEQAVAKHQPPLVRGRRIKLRYPHQGGRAPPVIVIHGNQTEQVPDAYTRYLENTYRDALKLYGTPIRIEYRTAKNPYAGKRNTLTPRQVRSKKRLLRRVKKK